MFKRDRFRESALLGSRRPLSKRVKLFLAIAPVCIVALIVIKIHLSLVGYYLSRVAWSSENFLVQAAYATASIYDATVIAVNSLRASVENKDVPVNSTLPTVQLHIEPSSLDKMLAASPSQKKSKYYPAQLMYPDGTWRPIQYRLRGRNIWHWQAKKPSLRLKLKKKYPIDMQRHINLVNPEDRPMIGNFFGEKLAAKFGVLTHKTRFVRLFINGEAKGVYHWKTREDESLLIAKKRMAGPFFAGDDLSYRWKASQFKISGDTKFLKKFNPMEQLIGAMYAPLDAGRYKKMWAILSKEKYAAWVAVNHLVGSIHTDFNHNNLFYFDPSAGLLEPVVSDMLGHGASLYPLYKYRIWQDFRPDPSVPLNERLYPLLDAALRDPTFYHLRNKLLYDALIGFGSASRQIEDLKKVFGNIDRDVFADLHKTSGQNTFVGDYPIPYSNAQYRSAKNDVFTWIREREKFLLDKLEASRFSVFYKYEASSGLIYFLVEVDGHSSVIFDPIALKTKVFSDRNFDGQASSPEKKSVLLYPGVKDFVGKNWNIHTYGEGRHIVPSPQKYLFAAIADGDADRIVKNLEGAFRHALTEKNIPIKVKRVDNLSRNGNVDLKSGVHAWQLDRQPSGKLSLGPGSVELTRNLIVSSKQSLTINPGTDIRLGENISIISHGRVEILGQPGNEVRFMRKDPNIAWGGLALVGVRARNSIIKHAQFDGGGKPLHKKIQFSGMVSAHGANGLSVTDTKFSSNILSDDTLHIVNGRVNLKDLSFRNCFGDCIDFDYVTGNLDGLKIENAGNDGIDFMNSEVKVSKFDIDGAGDKGVSAGENSSISLENGEIKNTEIGIAVKDASKVKTEGLRLIKNQIGIDLYVKHKLYGYPGRVFIAKTEFGANEVNVRSEAGANLFVRGQSLPSKMTGDGLVKLVAADGAK